MLTKLIVKLWPSFIPILSYLFWVFVIEKYVLAKLLKKKNVIEGQKVVGSKSTKAENASHFSLHNRQFVIVLYLTIIIAIVSLVFSALSNPNQSGSRYVPASYQDGKIVPSRFE